MFKDLHEDKGRQRILGFVLGLGFGVCLYAGGVTEYDVILGQLLLTDFTVVKVMLTAVVVGMVGVYAMKSRGMVELHPKPGSVGSTVVGGIIFGMGFAVLGYCPGTVAGAVGRGALDALAGGVTGILVGAGIFAAAYPALDETVLSKGVFRSMTIPDALRVNPWYVIIPVTVLIICLLAGMEYFGL
ncbi:YeeE/YedE thiosulfate transporter family protein [Methanogenium organophilum]|uniref:YeeE/YedE thiosulfate transporter family protein n=1 Tax=Methanogenium organophilum TaxID=2199 RepID=A0A9X9S3Y4_METOG|nr:YeeE/YedE thiosulfate transporter family protein [Methanogenium organophilum]WAI00455.1 YeeE/YedE thiosulfate transporter family protein [Methanogenium organophilum]